ncbi:hypothetical protein DCAR_0208742 [Daucus carota subsp. sativus]|uniref:Uncharacterized protein n=1 Tax=Daucus carota subsp. sativus TaxID=79200 RepID=A0A166ES31_DAUCS|nr:hypothetical protein DCAR_0208742 [Daucus carota subsp. sativus]
MPNKHMESRTHDDNGGARAYKAPAVICLHDGIDSRITIHQWPVNVRLCAIAMSNFSN